MDNSEALIQDGVIRDNGGDGIVAVNGAVVDVEGANVSWNGRYGINVDGGILEMMLFTEISGKMLHVTEMLIFNPPYLWGRT